MRKRLIIELSEEDFRSVAAAILRTGADFSVTSIGDKEEKPTRHIRRLTDDGKTGEMVIREYVAAHGGKVNKNDLPRLGTECGFAPNTLYGVANKLCEAAFLVRDKEWFKIKIEAGQ